VAAGIGVAMTVCVFIAMSTLAEGPSILQRLFRIFPLIFAEVSTTDECARPVLNNVLSIEGTVGTIGDAGFRPLADAEVIGSNAISDAVEVEVASDGRFRFATTFRDEAPSPCGEQVVASGGERQRLVFRAPGCAERRVPVTRAWVTHRVILDCTGGD
jgi:hypothetical protein